MRLIIARSVVRAHLGPPIFPWDGRRLPNEQEISVTAPIIGGLAQLGERLICIQEVNGSIPLFSTIFENGLKHLKNRVFQSGFKRGWKSTISNVRRPDPNQNPAKADLIWRGDATEQRKHCRMAMRPQRSLCRRFVP